MFMYNYTLCMSFNYIMKYIAINGINKISIAVSFTSNILEQELNSSQHHQ